MVLLLTLENITFFISLGILTHLPLTKGLIFLLFSSGALSTLEQEIVPDSPPASASKEYRKSLALSLFYKVLKSV